MIGIFVALGAAFSWTYACFMWRKQTNYFSAVQINLVKNIIAFIIFSPFLISFTPFKDFKNITILLLSGIIGITLGDTLYISALKRIGTRKTLTIEATSPVIANILGSFLIGESLSLKSWIGTLIVTFSLVILATNKSLNAEKRLKVETQPQKGLILGFLSVLCAVIAAILSRIVLINSNISPFQTTEIRLLGSILGLVPFVRINPLKLMKSTSPEIKLSLFFSTILGTNLGILLQQTVFKILPIGLGWTLLSTSPVISLFLAKSEGDEINYISILMTLTTLIGIGIILI